MKGQSADNETGINVVNVEEVFKPGEIVGLGARYQDHYVIIEDD